jgi:hypothetical protein
MKGTIRVAIGFFIVFGVVGGMDADPSYSILLGLALAVLGLGLMYSGVTAMNKDNYHG